MGVMPMTVAVIAPLTRQARRVIEVDEIRGIDTPASAQMTESPINTNTKSGGMRVEGRVTRPPKSTPTKRRSAALM